jgi:dihydrofolate reductase
MKMISLVVAMAANRVIGKDNGMPWHMPADLKHFKALTLGKPIIMGRKTFESLGRALPGRDNMVISSNPDYVAPGAKVYNSLSKAIDATDAKEVMVIGGAQIFEQALPLADTLYVTLIDIVPEGDTFFPKWDPVCWKEVLREVHEPDSHNPHAYTFMTLKKQ